MPKPYSNDLRRKLLEAHDRGDGSLGKLASRFGVSRIWAWKIAAQRLRTSRMERVEQRPGRRSKITAEVEGQLRSWGRQQPDVTLLELQQRLQETVRLHGSIGRLWQVLRRMELRLKKSRSTPKNKTLRKPNSAAQRGGRR